MLYIHKLFKSNIGTDFVEIGADLSNSDFQLSELGVERTRKVLMGFLPEMMNEQFFGPSPSYVGCIVRCSAGDAVIQCLTRLLQEPSVLRRLPVTEEEVREYMDILYSIKQQTYLNRIKVMT